MSRHLHACAYFLTITAIAFLADHLAQLFHFFDRHESFVWFPAGIGVALVLRFGLHTITPFCLGLFGYYFAVYGLPLWASLWTAVAWALSVYAFHTGFNALRRADLYEAPLHTILVFYAMGVVLTPTLHTLLDWPMLRFGGLLDPGEDLRVYAFSYFLGEAYSVLLLAPSVYLAGRDFRHFYAGDTAIYPANIGTEKTLWSLLVFALLLLTMYFGGRHFYAGIQDVEFLLYPMLAWSALRLGVLFTNLAVIVVSLSVFSFTAFGLAGTPAPLGNQTMIGLLTFILSIAVMAQLLAVMDLERRLRNVKLTYAATHDWLTDLGNVQSFRTAVAEQIALSGRTGQCYALGYIQANEHKILEHGYGLGARNALLRGLAGCLATGFTVPVALARISGGSFAVLFRNSNLAQAQAALEELHKRLQAFRFVWDAKVYHVAPSIRLAPVNADSMHADRLLQWISGELEAPEASAQVTLLVGDAVNSELQHRRERVHWLAELQDALETDRFQLVAQPIQRLGPEQQPGAAEPLRVEILVRLLSRAGTVLLPGEFLPYAERYGLLPQIDQWVCRNVCDWLAAQPSAFLAAVAKVSINLSGQSLGDPGFRHGLLDYLRASAVPMSKLCFEITESEAISNLQAAVGFFEQLRGSGAAVSLDDFGTGLSSFEYLKHFCVDYLKIDGIFVRSLTPGSHDYAVVKAMQSVASAMQIETIAEYAESAEVVSCLRELGVNYVQGYAISRPLPLTALGNGAGFAIT